MPQKSFDTAQNTDIIPVFFNADNNYAVQAYITVFSMMYNYKGAANVNVYILTSDTFSDKNTALFDYLTDRFDKLQLTILNMDDKYDNVSISQAYISNASMHRLEIPRIVEEVLGLQVDRCIYLDCDLVVEGDISELFNTDIDGCYVGGVPDPLQFYKKYVKHAERIGIPDRNQYINSGVLLLNLKEINANPDVREKLEKAGLKEEMLYKDQDAINYAFYGGIKLLPARFNAFPIVITKKDKGFFKIYGKANLEEAQKNPFILHYIGILKPWLYTTEYLSQRWWKYVRMQSRTVKREHIKPFIMNNKRMSLEDKLLLAIRGRLRRTGRYYELLDEKNKHILDINERLKKYNP